MSDNHGAIDVSADGEHRYAAVLTTAAGTRTEHLVTSDTALLEKLQATSADEPFLVRRVLEVLLQAEEAAEEAGHLPALPTVIDLTALDAERPDLLASIPLR
ncbi:hypothetical protein ACFQ46_06515 [Kineococcus sp. GCM10028916]|jgi:hypothetical protein|uniref:hypothetical protein n=1 Tax=Kineococcus sp. GCM10028916 TaxID=3273394 RepID=UPI0036284711